MFGLGTLQTIGAGIIIALLMSGGAYMKGRYDGRQIERAATLKAAIDQLKERQETDAEVRDMDAFDLCRSLGGSVPECEEYK